MIRSRLFVFFILMLLGLQGMQSVSAQRSRSRNLGPVFDWKGGPEFPVLISDGPGINDFARQRMFQPYRDTYRQLRMRAEGYADPNNTAYLGEEFWNGTSLQLLEGAPDRARYVAQALEEMAFVSYIEKNRALARSCITGIAHIVKNELPLIHTQPHDDPSIEQNVLAESRLFLSAVLSFDLLFRRLETYERQEPTQLLIAYHNQRDPDVLLEGVSAGPARVLVQAGQVLASIALAQAERIVDRNAFETQGLQRWLGKLLHAVLMMEEEVQAVQDPQILLSQNFDWAADALWSIDLSRDVVLRLGGQSPFEFNDQPTIELLALTLIPVTGTCVNPFNTLFDENPYQGWPPVYGNLFIGGTPAVSMTGTPLVLALPEEIKSSDDEKKKPTLDDIEIPPDNPYQVGKELTPDQKARELIQVHLRNVFSRRNATFKRSPSEQPPGPPLWMPKNLIAQPTPWSAWLRRRAATSPSGTAGRLWRELSAGGDSHPASMLLPLPPQPRRSIPEPVDRMIPNFGNNLSLLRIDDNREHLLWAVQQDIVDATSNENIVGHLIVDRENPWRWVERWPSDMLAPAKDELPVEQLTAETVHIWRTPGRTDRWHIVRERLPYAQRLAWVIASSRGADALPEYLIDLQLNDDEHLQRDNSFPERFYVSTQVDKKSPLLMTAEEQILQNQMQRAKQMEAAEKTDVEKVMRDQRIDFIAETQVLKHMQPVISVWGRRERLVMSPSDTYTSYLISLADERPIPPQVRKMELQEGAGWRLDWVKGREMIAFTHGNGIEGDHLSTDAVGVMLNYNKVQSFWTYVAIEATRLRYFVTTLEPEGTTLLQSPVPVTMVLDGRVAYFMGEAPDGAVIFAPNLLAVRDRNGSVPFRVHYNKATIDRNRLARKP